MGEKPSRRQRRGYSRCCPDSRHSPDRTRSPWSRSCRRSNPMRRRCSGCWSWRRPDREFSLTRSVAKSPLYVFMVFWLRVRINRSKRRSQSRDHRAQLQIGTPPRSLTLLGRPGVSGTNFRPNSNGVIAGLSSLRTVVSVFIDCKYRLFALSKRRRLQSASLRSLFAPKRPLDSSSSAW
jgi:hypothetical protein